MTPSNVVPVVFSRIWVYRLTALVEFLTSWVTIHATVTFHTGRGKRMLLNKVVIGKWYTGVGVLSAFSLHK